MQHFDKGRKYILEVIFKIKVSSIETEIDGIKNEGSKDIFSLKWLLRKSETNPREGHIAIKFERVPK